MRAQLAATCLSKQPLDYGPVAERRGRYLPIKYAVYSARVLSEFGSVELNLARPEQHRDIII
jgi:hypothetical protein